ncbi:hypothetical protein PG985_004413 [Apiospora marii]|uniref:uncharacterized protein n=1 Tax=Apiospora marii TaxID=335849 RepID=UPI003132712D
MAITTWFLCLTTLAVVSHGARIRVDVGSNGAPALVYTPKVVTAQVGDIVDFHFVDENAASSVVRGVAGAPCTPFTPTKKGFFNSGFVLGDPTGSNVFSVKINETTPIPIYCSVGGHCRAGMIGYINPGQGDFEAYASATAKLTQNQPPPMVPQTGGVFQQGVDGGYIMITFVNGGPGGGGGSSGGSAGDPLASAADALLGAPGGSKGSKGSRRAN